MARAREYQHHTNLMTTAELGPRIVRLSRWHIDGESHITRWALSEARNAT